MIVKGKKVTITRILGGISRALRFWRYVWRKRQYAKYCITDNVKRPIHITPKYIELGERVSIWYHARIEGIRKYNNTIYTPRIIIHDGVSVQQNLHLTCACQIEIGDNTAIAANVTITDIHHPYTDVTIPIEKQDLEVASVKIGRDCKIYNNVVILPGTVIGNHVTVGANSVVKGTYLDNCVVAGIPAVIVKRYDSAMGEWRKTDKRGIFI